MPYFKRDGATIYYEESGAGDPVIALHGLIGNTSYWGLTGVMGTLSKKFRFISMEMRGHGRTVVDEKNPGYDADTVGGDILVLADHLGLGRFHMLTHSTGGFAAVRQAMKDWRRFATLTLTDTGSFTSPIDAAPEVIRGFHEKFAASFEKFSWTRSWRI